MSKNLSKEKRERLLGEIAQLREKMAGCNDSARFLSYLSDLEREIDGKKYGLVFEEHREQVDALLEGNVPVLEEQESLKLARGGQWNFLIEGDNLASLKLLEKTHCGRIQMIYIDPPYNTGNKDFVYDDNRVDPTDAFRHSKWLSFMKCRLLIASRLLTEQGVIFISINDNELYGLKQLCDEIFGEQNFVANIVVESNPRGSQSPKQIASVHEYILVYAKEITRAAIIGHGLSEEMQSEYSYRDEKGNFRLLGLRQRGGYWRAIERPKLYYPFYIDPKNADLSLVRDSAHKVEVYPVQPSTGEKASWRWSREKVKLESDKLIAKKVKRGADFEWDIYQKDYLAAGKSTRRTKAKSLWDDKELNYQNAANELKKLFGVSPFSHAKPTYLIRRALEMVDFKESDYVLDFFAGSGTTGHAVMMLNAEDGGNRKFILCTNNENGICREITYERLKRAIDLEGYEASLKYCKVGFVPITEQVYYEYADKLLLHIRELVELENGLDFNGNRQVAICLTDDELREFAASCKRGECKAVYVGHNVLVSSEIEGKLSRREIKINVIPDYYYKELRD